MKISPILLNPATVVGGLLLPIGALLPLFVADFMYAFLVFTLGAVLFAGAQFLDRRASCRERVCQYV